MSSFCPQTGCDNVECGLSGCVGRNYRIGATKHKKFFSLPRTGSKAERAAKTVSTHGHAQALVVGNTAEIWRMRIEADLVATRGTYVLYNGNMGMIGLLIGTRNIQTEAGRCCLGFPEAVLIAVKHTTARLNSCQRPRHQVYFISYSQRLLADVPIWSLEGVVECWEEQHSAV